MSKKVITVAIFFVCPILMAPTVDFPCLGLKKERPDFSPKGVNT